VSPQLPDGILAVVKRECPTCVLVEPVLSELASALKDRLTVYSQDDPFFPREIPGVVDDRSLEVSWHLDLTTVPTLVKVEDGKETDRVVGWDRQRWEKFTGVAGLGPGLPEYRPGCGSRHLEPEIARSLAVRFRGGTLRSRRVRLGEMEDDMEAMWDRGWTDGLPVVPPTEARVLAMLEGSSRTPDEVVAAVPPNLAPATVEKVAINAVMAGCRPEYLPVVVAAVEAACTDEFNIHGVLATTWFAGPVVIVNGPVSRAIGMNSGVNALGQGNRANATIGRALQLVIRNVGGGRPGEIDRATLGTPGKYTFCFAEDEAGSPWESLAAERGFPSGVSAVTVFAGGGVRGVVDQQSRTPESLARSLAACLRGVSHPKLVLGFDACLVVSPDHGRVFRDAGWSRARLRAELAELLLLPADELIQGAGGIAEGVPGHLAGRRLPKFREGGLLLVYAGGGAGLFSAIIDGWVGGAGGSIPVTREVLP
jgi:thiol-disulfide isomerase/thioredoxin